MLAAVTYVAYANDGLLVCLTVTMLLDFAQAPVAGCSPPSVLELVGFALLSALLMGLPLGVVGYLLGAVARFAGAPLSIGGVADE